MGKLLSKLEDLHTDFIKSQHMFFVATADKDSKINLSPKGLDTLHIENPNLTYWLNLTGSGNETAAHLLNDERMTLMFCSFTSKPMILRVYGKAQNLEKTGGEYAKALDKFPKYTGIRQIFSLKIDSVLTSCGHGVPLYEYQGPRQRPSIPGWADKKGEDGILEYQQLNNVLSLDGKPTDINKI